MTKRCRGRYASILTSVALGVGCAPTATPPAPPAQQAAPSDAKVTDDHGHPHTAEEGHGHGAGPHEGTLADWGGGKYHVEFTVDHDKQEATVYVLGSDEKTPARVKTADGKLLLTIKEPSFQLELLAQPLEGETDDNASRYVGKHEKLGTVQEFAGTISGEVDGTPYAGDFKEKPHSHEVR